MAKSRISVYLVKKDVVDPADYIDLEKVSETQVIEAVGTLYIRPSHPSVPRWATSFFLDRIDSEMLINSSASALLAVKVPCDEDERIFLLSFGYGYTLRKREAIDERFGLRTVLNLANPDALRAISRTTVAGNAMKASEQLPTKSSIDEFALDAERDLLEKVTIASDEEDAPIRGSITGGESLAFSVDVDLGGIVELLQNVFLLYASERYKESFSFIDQIMPVKDKTIIGALDSEAIRLINERSKSIWMAVPEVVKWEETAGFSISGQEDIQSDVLVENILEACGGVIRNIDVLKDMRVSMMDVDGLFAKESWRAYRCLYGELQYRGEQYCINNGRWYRIANEYAEAINSSYSKARVSDISFPGCPASSYEGAYNELLASSGGPHFALMDKKVIRYGGGRNQVELCDVLTDEGKFIHVKNYSGSATLSHLFNQGCVSAELMKSDIAFVENARKKIEEVAPNFAMEVNSGAVKEVVYGIITKDDADLPSIPFFSKVTFHAIERRLNAMGVRVSIKGIRRS